MTEESQYLEKVVLGEIEGKNRAIHAYDSISWKVRTGFLTLLFGGWAIVLKGIAETPEAADGVPRSLILALLLFSVGFAFGAWFIDRSYVRRKFRVIQALDSLIEEFRACGSDYFKISSKVLKVSGDNIAMPYDSDSYREAAKAELSVYLVPLTILAAIVVLVLP